MQKINKLSKQKRQKKCWQFIFVARFDCNSSFDMCSLFTKFYCIFFFDFFSLALELKINASERVNFKSRRAILWDFFSRGLKKTFFCVIQRRISLELSRETVWVKYMCILNYWFTEYISCVVWIRQNELFCELFSRSGAKNDDISLLSCLKNYFFSILLLFYFDFLLHFNFFSFYFYVHIFYWLFSVVCLREWVREGFLSPMLLERERVIDEWVKR